MVIRAKDLPKYFDCQRDENIVFRVWGYRGNYEVQQFNKFDETHKFRYRSPVVLECIGVAKYLAATHG